MSEESGSGLGEEEAVSKSLVPTALVVDTSSSMGPMGSKGDTAKIEVLNKGLETFKEEVMSADDVEKDAIDVDVSLIEFDSDVEIVDDFQDIEQWDPPTLSDGGNTSMSEAIRVAQNHIEDYQNQLESDNVTRKKAQMWVLTDGEPTDDEDNFDQTHTKWDIAKACVRDGTKEGDILFYGVCIGDEADIDKMKDLASEAPKNRKEIFEIEEEMFKELFEVMSESATEPTDEADLE